MQKFRDFKRGSALSFLLTDVYDMTSRSWFIQDNILCLTDMCVTWDVSDVQLSHVGRELIILTTPTCRIVLQPSMRVSDEETDNAYKNWSTEETIRREKELGLNGLEDLYDDDL